MLLRAKRMPGNTMRYLAVLNVSITRIFTAGVAPCALLLHGLVADALLRSEWHHATFISYLRTCSPCGGFPGWECVTDAPERALAILREGLLPL